MKPIHDEIRELKGMKKELAKTTERVLARPNGIGKSVQLVMLNVARRCMKALEKSV